MTAQRTYATGFFSLVLDGVDCGLIKSVDGGAITAEVINEASGPNYFVKKHISQLKYEEFVLDIDLNMNKAIYDWIAASWNMNYQRKNGSIIVLDYKLNAVKESEFHNALITEVTIPACDGSSKEPAYLRVKFAPEHTRHTKSSKKAKKAAASKQKVWLPSNFRMAIDGLDCTKVVKIDAFTIKQTALSDDIGDSRDYVTEPGKLEFPNLTLLVSDVAAQTWYDWHEDFVIKGNNDDSKEKGGELNFLSANRKDELLTIKFHNLGIFKLISEKTDANTDAIKRVKAHLYCERMEFIYPNIKA